MSVPAGERKENQFALHMSAVGLAGHTLRITANPKVFKPHINPAIIQRICELSVGIAENIEKANRVQLNASKTNFNMRRKYQNYAYEQTRSLISDIKVAAIAHKMRHRKVSYWLRQYEELSYQILRWMKSDDIRFQQNVKESKKENQLANKDKEQSS